MNNIDPIDDDYPTEPHLDPPEQNDLPTRIVKEFANRKEREAELKRLRKEYWNSLDKDNDPADGENKQGWS